LEMLGSKEHRMLHPRKDGWRTHCKRGHEMTMGNTVVDSKGIRRCRACNAFRVARWRAQIRKEPMGVQVELVL
jgi:hypothetical protein